jgi:hypothetical protein
MRFVYALVVGALLAGTPLSLAAQQDLFAEMDSASEGQRPVLGTFKGVRIINQHSIEVTRGGTLEFVVQHRFGSVRTPNSVWGLDEVGNTRLGFEYGLTDRWMVGVGRSTYQDLMDVFAKCRVLRQTQDDQVPVSVTVHGQWNFTTDYVFGPVENNTVGNRSRFSVDLLIARRMNSRLSVQVSATGLYFPLKPLGGAKNFVLGSAASGRYKVSKRVALTAEVALPVTSYLRASAVDYPAIGVGVDIETGGHVFQLQLTNALGVVPSQYQAYNTERFDTGGFRLGFNLHRSFGVGKRSRS